MTALPFGIQRVGFRKVPHVPTPTERMQQYRLRQPVQFANTQFNRSPSSQLPNPSPAGRASSLTEVTK